MSQELTLEVAQEFLKDNDAVRLSKFNSIADAAAVALAKNEIYLYLRGLTTLSDVAAEALSKHKGGLDLGGLTTLSDAAAEALGKIKGDYLYLSGLTTLSDAAAEVLGKHEGELVLGGLTTLSDAAAGRCKPVSVICPSSLQLHPFGVRRSEPSAAEPQTGEAAPHAQNGSRAGHVGSLLGCRQTHLTSKTIWPTTPILNS